jgi:hypothetical protein
MGVAYRYPPDLRVVRSHVISGPLAVPALVPVTPPAQIRQLPANVDLVTYAGDDFSFDLPVTNPDGTPTDLTGATTLAQIRKQDDLTAVVATFAVAVATNVLTLTLASADSQAMSGEYVWDCQVTYGDGKVSTIAAGDLDVTPDVSHP